MKKIQSVRPWKYWVLIVMQLFITMTVFSNNVSAQEKVLSVKFEKETLLSILEYLSNKSGCVILYNHEQVKNVKDISLEMEEKTLGEILGKCLEKTKFTYKLVDGVYAITQRPDEKKKEEKRVLTGTVKDEYDMVLPGATVLIKGTTVGVVTDKDGLFKLELPDLKELTIVISFMGFESQEIKIDKQKDLMIVLKEKKEELEDVVVTGYANVKKSSFTGTSIRVGKEDLLKVASRNVIDVLQVFDPSLRMMKNNIMGSDPNTMPEFYIRGRSGIGVKELDASDVSETALKNNPNLPLFIMDGFEVNVQKVYDFDPNRIESITILKDAAATAVYGSRAANGVIVIETKAPLPGRVQVSYNFTGALTVPDLSDYNLMNAKEKLEAEYLSGYYTEDDYDYGKFSEYQSKLNNIRKGVNTDWISKPLENQFNHTHSLYIEGGSKDLRFGLDLKYDNQNGVMKKSGRNRVGAGFYVDYRIKNLQIRNQVTYDVVRAKNSPYGSFSDYTTKLPYDVYKDEEGNMLKSLEFGDEQARKNPLYEASLKNFDKNGYSDLTNNLGVNWYILDALSLKGQLAITKRDADAETFVDPDSYDFSTSQEGDPKGRLTRSNTSDFNWNMNVVVNYLKTVQKHNMNFSLGINARETKTRSDVAMYKGFPSGALHSPAFAEEISEKPKFTDNNSRLFGAFVRLNYTYNDVYLLDLSARLDGSSEFGADKKTAPFYSMGAGINFHNYDFLKDHAVFSKIKLTATYGQLGKTDFPPYAAKHMYEIMQDYYGTGNGVFINYMGNDDLKWERTNTTDVKLDLGFLQDAVTLNVGWYDKKTVDAISDITIPASSGFTVYKDNLGEVRNRGIEIDFRADIIRKKDVSLAVFGNLAHNKNEILKIADSMKAYNELVDSQYDDYDKSEFDMADPKYGKTFVKYVEGGTMTTIWGMRSLGINPTDGKEIYMRPDGTLTYDWNASDQIVLGDTEPKAQGSFGVNLAYKGFSLYMTFMYEWGAQVYNETLVSKVENVDVINSNADKRVLMDRWNKFGQITPLKSIQDRNKVTRPTSRFVEDNNILDFNSLTLGYEFQPDLIRKIGLSMLRLQFNMKDIAHFSSVKQERGLSYPFARTFNFTLNASF